MLTPQELGVCRESNKINGEKKIVLCLTSERKKLFALNKV